MHAQDCKTVDMKSRSRLQCSRKTPEKNSSETNRKEGT